MITRENYEIYFTDYLDGVLAPSGIQELKTFLLLNPDLEELLEDTGQAKLILPEIKYMGKKNLKKEEFHECPDYYTIAAAENSLTDKDRIQLGKRIYNSDFQLLVCIYKRIRFNPDLNVHFEKKNNLYKKRLSSVIILRRSGIAALILLLLGIGTAILHPLRMAPVTLAPSIIRTLPVSPLPSMESAEIAECTVQPVITHKSIQMKYPEPREENINIKEEISVTELIPLEQKTIIPNDKSFTLSLKSEELSNKIYPEIILSKSAGEWKPSDSNIQTKDIFTSTVNAGKNIVEKIRSKNLGIENIFSE